MSELRVLFLTKYDRLGASSRLRALQYLRPLENAGISVTVAPLMTDELLRARYKARKHAVWNFVAPYVQRFGWMLRLTKFDVVWIEKEALPWTPWWLEYALLRQRPYVLDYDDAVFHSYEFHRVGLARKLFGKRLDRLMARAALVVGGNNYLAQRAKDAGCGHVEVVPTVIDLERYSARPAGDGRGDERVLRVVWIGSPATVHYLGVVAEPLRQLAEDSPFILRIIGGNAFSLPGVEVEIVPWSEDSEVNSIRGADIGIMPLLDSPWEKGKCGYKLIQYMACGLPVVASDVGVNGEIVDAGKNGFLARTPEEWIEALRQLLNDPALRETMGRAGRAKVEATYCIQQTGPKLADLLRNAALGVR